MNLQVSAKSKETNTIEGSTMYVVFKDPKQVLVQDSLGCVYSLDLVHNACSCGKEVLPCPHLAFYYKKIARQPQCVNICGICYESNQFAETCCFACKSLFHLDCIQQLNKLGGETCPVCRAAWKKVPRICTHCRFTRNPPYYMCLKCSEAIICKKCRDMKIHPSHALICSLGGYWSAGIMPCVELLRRAMEIRPGICSECGNHAEDLSKLRCGHLIHKNCLEKKMYDKKLKCGVCKVSMFGCLDEEKSRYSSPGKVSSRNLSPSKSQGTISIVGPSSLYNVQSNRGMSSRFIPSPPLLKNRSYTPNRQLTFKLESNKHEFEAPYIFINCLEPTSTKSESNFTLALKSAEVRSPCKTPALARAASEMIRKEAPSPVIRIQIKRPYKTRISRTVREQSIHILKKLNTSREL